MERKIYEIMHKDQCAARLESSGRCRIFCGSLLPWNLYLEPDTEELDALVNNVTNFYYWCATRVLTLDRQYAKEILNSIGAGQAMTDRDRAAVALSYRCVTVTDVFWVRLQGETVTFAEVNLYNNHLSNAFVDISLRGRQYSVQNEELARDLSTGGCFPKAWLRREGGFRLLKGGGEDAVKRELTASRICRCFAVSQVIYEEEFYDGERVSASDNFTDQEYSIASMEAFAIHVQNQEQDLQTRILSLDRYNYYMMNIVDYLIGNTDRHWGNWGVLVRTADNQPVSLHRLMDFNRAFSAYDTLEGANCQTTFSQRMTQKEAALEAVRQVGLNQICPVEQSCFAGMEQYYAMFLRRLRLLQTQMA